MPKISATFLSIVIGILLFLIIISIGQQGEIDKLKCDKIAIESKNLSLSCALSKTIYCSEFALKDYSTSDQKIISAIRTKEKANVPNHPQYKSGYVMRIDTEKCMVKFPDGTIYKYSLNEMFECNKKFN